MKHLTVDHEFMPVGQGLFCFGMVQFSHFKKGRRRILLDDYPADWHYSWVYDCGSSSSQALVNRGIRSVASKLAGNMVDLVVISHLHSDHISGLIRLLIEIGAKTIMLPWAPLWERLLIGFEQGLVGEDRELEFYVDPVGYLTTAAPDRFERVIFVPRKDGTGEGGHPDEPIPGIDPLRFGRDKDPKHRTETDSKISMGMELPDTHVNQSSVMNFSSDFRLICAGAWEFVPYNDPKSAPKCPDTFKNRVNEYTKELLGDGTSERSSALHDLKDLYRKEFRPSFQNELSLNLYTGPVPLSICETATRRTTGQISECRLPILYTGDANYSTPSHRLRLKKHLGEQRINAVATFQVPHHGSKRNWCAGMADFFKPTASIFSSDPSTHYEHPHAAVLRDFYPYGVIQVNKHSGSSFTECLTFNRRLI